MRLIYVVFMKLSHFKTDPSFIFNFLLLFNKLALMLLARLFWGNMHRQHSCATSHETGHVGTRALIYKNESDYYYYRDVSLNHMSQKLIAR